MSRLTRREALGTLSAGLIGAAVSRAATGSASMQGEGLAMDYGWLRGFSVVPSWGARIEEAWWAYSPERFREEIAPATRMHANCLRLWLEFTAWMANPEAVTAAFVDAVHATREAGMRAMPCLFNRWHDWQWDYGGTYTDDLYRDWAPKLAYVREIVGALKDDDAVLIWDLCNEPQSFGQADDWALKEREFFRQVSVAVRESGATQPLTIGTMIGANIETFAEFVDVLCAHPYAHTEAELLALIAGYAEQSARLGKPMLVNECIPGCLDDLRRAEIARIYTARLAEAGLGWMGWALREGKAISTRRDRHDANGLDGQGFHPFVTRSGELRAGLEFLTEEPSRRAPWEG